MGLVIGKPLGITLATWLAVRAGLADQPTEFSWRQVAGAGALCGIGFTMSIFIADAAFADSGPLALAKVSVMVACVLAAGLAGSDPGFEVASRLSLTRGALRPVATVAVPVFFTDGPRPGVRGVLCGIRLSPIRVAKSCADWVDERPW